MVVLWHDWLSQSLTLILWWSHVLSQSVSFYSVMIVVFITLKGNWTSNPGSVSALLKETEMSLDRDVELRDILTLLAEPMKQSTTDIKSNKDFVPLRAPSSYHTQQMAWKIHRMMKIIIVLFLICHYVHVYDQVLGSRIIIISLCSFGKNKY